MGCSSGTCLSKAIWWNACLKGRKLGVTEAAKFAYHATRTAFLRFEFGPDVTRKDWAFFERWMAVKEHAVKEENMRR